MEDINITNGTILESLNNKADIDGGNYKGSGLQAVLEETTLGTAGGTLTGPLVISTNEDTQLRNLSLRFTSVDFDTPPSAIVYPNIEFQDEQGRRMARVEYTFKTNGEHTIGIIDKKDANTASYAAVRVGYTADGNPICDFPKCVTKATTTSSARSDLVAVVVQNYVSGTSWYRVWSDGWIEQGGYKNGKGDVSISLLKKFTNTNYQAQMTPAYSSYLESAPVIKTSGKTTSAFIVYTVFDYAFYWYACGY